jgi:hypothetical protein
MREPSAEAKRYTEFCKTWDALPDFQRQQFVGEFSADIRELLADTDGDKLSSANSGDSASSETDSSMAARLRTIFFSC